MDLVLWGDIFRVANIAAGSMALGMSLWITVNYALAYRESRKEGGKWLRLLPYHVALIGLSYDLLVITLLTAFTSNQHTPMTWRHPVYFVAFVLGVIALRPLTHDHRKRTVRLPTDG